jgi:hypothetical protein
MSEVCDDSDIGEPFTILRSNGIFVAGGFSSTTTTIAAWGIVTVAKPKELDMIPEGDRQNEVRAFYVTQPLYVTRDNAVEGTGVSDVLVWNNIQYRVMVEPQYSNRGYWKALATKLTAA